MDKPLKPGQYLEYVPIDEEQELIKRFIKLTVLVPDYQLQAASPDRVVAICEHILLAVPHH